MLLSDLQTSRSSSTRRMCLVVICIVVLCTAVEGYPQGVPTDSCETIAPMKTQGHSQPLADAPYVLLQTAISYKQGQVINVSIQRKKSDASFEGFMVQAIDKMSGKHIGRFLDADGLHLIDECSIVMQKDKKPKIGVQLAWVAPLNERGDVLFRSTIVEKKTRYYDGLMSRLEPPRQ